MVSLQEIIIEVLNNMDDDDLLEVWNEYQLNTR